MFKFMKKTIPYVLLVVIAGLIMSFVTFNNKYQLKPKQVYKVYLDGKEVGNIKDKQELEDYINEEQQELKDAYSVDKVYVPQGVSIQNVTTYEKDVLTAKQVHNIIKEEKPFTLKGYKITIKADSDDEKKVINVLDKSIFDKAIRSVLEAFVPKDDINNFENDSQPEIKDTGRLIEDIYIDQGITVKQAYIPADEEIFTDEKKLTKYLLFGEVKDDQYYTVKEGDTIESIAYDNKLAVDEFLVVNPEFTSANNLLSVGQQVKVGLINPVLDVVVESHTILDQESQFMTETKYDETLDKGVQKVEVEGQTGVDRLTTKIKTVNGEDTNVIIVSHETITPAVNKVVRVGTKSSGYSGGPIVISDGTWAWPTIPQYFISSYFGYRWGKVHEAIDIAGSGEGSPIFAAGAGNVITAKKNGGSLGNYVVINHNNGYYTIYGHMSSLTVSEGQAVEKGQQIGTMGHTGFATGTHLHFGLYKNGVPYRGGIPLDPLILYR